MNTRIVIVHRWGGSPNADWYPWLRLELQKKGYEVLVPVMPNPESPNIATWVETLKTAIGQPTAETYLVGHSIGCQTILRYLETLAPNERVGGAVFVAGWLELTNLTADDQTIAHPWLSSPIDPATLKAKCRDGAIAIFSEDDPLVPMDNVQFFTEQLGAEAVVQQRKGHFTAEDGVTELPSVLSAVMKLMQGESAPIESKKEE